MHLELSPRRFSLHLLIFAAMFALAAVSAAPAGTLSIGSGNLTDSDSDGVIDRDDNAPNLQNADQADFDNDGLGDAIDPSPSDSLGDADSDGAVDAADADPFNASVQTLGFDLGGPYSHLTGDDLVLSFTTNPLAESYLYIELTTGGAAAVAEAVWVGAPGESVTITASQLQTLGWDSVGTYTIWGRAMNSYSGAFATDSTMVTVVPEPSWFAAVAMAGAALRRRRSAR